MEQLSFDLPRRTALGRADFFVAPPNAHAVAMMDGWQNWPNHKLVLTGPEGSGKTHLTHIWAQMAGAPVVAAKELLTEDVPRLAQTPLAVEDVPQIAQNAPAQEALFHLHNQMQSAGHSLLLTGRGAVGDWGLTLPDLASRMGGTLAVALDPPDDRMLMAVMMKLFADRQLNPAPDLIPYAVKRLERSFAAAGAFVDALDRAALAQKAPLTRAFAQKTLSELSLGASCN
jgi:chromosomal replication initiation ATPase DnaA